eukprot:g2695.t1
MHRHNKNALLATQADDEKEAAEVEGQRRRLSVFNEGADNWKTEAGAMTQEQRAASVALYNDTGRRTSLPGQLPPSLARRVPPLQPQSLLQKRKALHKSILEQEHAELVRSRRVLEPLAKKRRALLLAKNESSTKQFNGLTVDRVARREALNDALLDMDRAAVAAEVANVADQAEQIVAERLSESAVLRDVPREQARDAFREVSLHNADRALFSQSMPMQNDFESFHVGDVKRLVLSDEERQRQAEELRQMKLFAAEDEKRKTATAARKTASDALAAAREAQAAVRAKTENLTSTGKAMSFEARAKARRALAVEKEQSDAAMLEAEALLAESQKLKADLKGADTENDEWLENLIGGGDDDAEQVLGRGDGIKSWFIGFPDDGTAGLGTILYGNYSTSDTPPEDGWHPVQGKAPAPALKVTAGRVKVWISQGAGDGSANGSFTKSAKRDGVDQFCKVDGMTLYRSTIKENADLGLTKETCNPVVATAAHEKANASTDVQMPLDKVEKKDPISIRRLMSDPFDFTALQKAGHMLGIQGITEQRDHKRKQEAAAEKKLQELFDAARKQASAALDEHKDADDEADKDSSAFGSKKKKVKGGMSLKAEMHAAESVKMAALQAPNITYQATAADAALLLGEAPRVFNNVDPEHVPPLCRAWVMCACGKSGIACPGRHYYVSEEEKAYNEELRSSTDMKLETEVLRCISRREQLLEALQTASTQALKKYQMHMTKVKHEDVADMLNLLEQLRLASVQTIEAIQKWRGYVENIGRMMEDHAQGAKEPAGGWSVSITVEGAELYGASTAFNSKVKRWCREYEPPKREKKRMYLGCFKTKNEAARAFDDATAMQAIKLNTTADRMPKKVFVFRSCGRHFGIESENAGPSKCEECTIQKMGGAAAYTPSP